MSTPWSEPQSDNPDRRDFCKRTAAAGGGLVLALTLPAFAGGPQRSASGQASAHVRDSQLNAWLKIGSDNSVTFIVDRSEMGQGVYTALPMLLAEELNIDMGVIRIEAAPVGDAYINPGNGGQVTGTSNSVQDAWEKLRMAGATARTMLISAAAKRWRIDPAQCHVANGTVINSQGKALTFGELADAAAKEPVPKGLTLKSRSDFQIIGKARARTDTPGKVDGSATFGLDVKLPGMLHAVLAQSPVLGGKVRAVDAGALRSDVSTEEMVGLVMGACQAGNQAGSDDAGCQRMVEIVCDGLRSSVTSPQLS